MLFESYLSNLQPLVPPHSIYVFPGPCLHYFLWKDVVRVQYLVLVELGPQVAEDAIVIQLVAGVRIHNLLVPLALDVDALDVADADVEERVESIFKLDVVSESI
jgi:hypothetical protein